MSETRKLDKTGLQQVWNNIVLNFGTKAIQEALKQKLDNIQEKAQVNVIESVKVNGVELEVDEKGVNIVVPKGALASLDKVGVDQLSEEIKNIINGKVSAATTLSGYGITDAYTKSQTDTAISNAVKTAVTGVYKVKGSVAVAALPSLSSSDVTEGDVYNITEAFTSTDSFKDGSGKTYPAGTNVAAVSVGGRLMWDAMAGTYDFSDYIKTSDLVDITTEEINSICVLPS